MVIKKLIFFLMVVISLSSASALSCSIKLDSQCNSPDYKIIYLSGITNAHANKTQGDYQQVLCCDKNIFSCNTDDSNILLRMSSDTNAHIGVPEATGVYSNKICLGGISCKSKLNDCETGYIDQIISLTGLTNSHVGTFGDYTTKLCCKDSELNQKKIYWADLNGDYLNNLRIERSRIDGDSSADVKMIFEDYTGGTNPNFIIKYFYEENEIMIKTIIGTATGNLATALWAINCQQDLVAKGIDVNCDPNDDTLEAIPGSFTFEVGEERSDPLSMSLTLIDGGFTCQSTCEELNIIDCELADAETCPAFFYGPIERIDDATQCVYNENGNGCFVSEGSCKQNTNAILKDSSQTDCRICSNPQYTPLPKGECNPITKKFNVTLIPTNPSCEPIISVYDCVESEMLPFFNHWNLIVSVILIVGIYIYWGFLTKKSYSGKEGKNKV